MPTCIASLFPWEWTATVNLHCWDENKVCSLVSSESGHIEWSLACSYLHSSAVLVLLSVLLAATSRIRSHRLPLDSSHLWPSLGAIQVGFINSVIAYLFIEIFIPCLALQRGCKAAYKHCSPWLHFCTHKQEPCEVRWVRQRGVYPVGLSGCWDLNPNPSPKLSPLCHTGWVQTVKLLNFTKSLF